jgi:hypothetical protein
MLPLSGVAVTGKKRRRERTAAPSTAPKERPARVAPHRPRQSKRSAWPYWVGGAVALLGAAIAVIAFQANPGASRQASPTPAAAPGASIDGIKCEIEMVQTHFHAHLTLIQDGSQVPLASQHWHQPGGSMPLLAAHSPGRRNRSDALLFQNVPDLDNIALFKTTAPSEVDVSIRAVGELQPRPTARRGMLVPAPAGVKAAAARWATKGAVGGFLTNRPATTRIL